MSIQVFHDVSEDKFPIKIEIHGHVNESLTVKAAIELSQKLESAISDYQVFEALKGNKG